MGFSRVYSGSDVHHGLLAVSEGASFPPLRDRDLVNVEAPNTLCDYLLPVEQILVPDFIIALIFVLRLVFFEVLLYIVVVLHLLFELSRFVLQLDFCQALDLLVLHVILGHFGLRLIFSACRSLTDFLLLEHFSSFCVIWICFIEPTISTSRKNR